MAVYVSIRALTCILPFLHLFLQVSADQDAQYGLELAALVLVLTLLVSLPYALVLGSFLADGHESVRKRWTVLTVAVGTLDLVSALAIVAFTDGWSSQFRHYWFTALLFPCLVLGMRRSLVLAVICIVGTNIALNLKGGQWFGRQDDLLYVQIGFAVSIVIVAGVIGYLGDLVYELQRNRRSAEVARDNLETMLEITQYTAVLTSGLNDLMLRMARAIGERHRYQIVGIYLLEPGGNDMRLAGWLGEVEALRRHELHGDNLVHQAISAMDARFVQDGKSWNAAIPIRDADSPMGVLLIGSAGPGTDIGSSMTGLGHALVGHIAVGIQVARLRQRLESAATQHESQRITRQIHDRISSSLYSLMLYLETYAEQARLEGSPVHRRLESLIPSFAQLLIETRHYMYHLLPALRGESGLDALVDSMVAEFERASGIPVRLTIGGSAAHVPMTATMGLYHVLQYRLSDILLLSKATVVEICLTIESENISLSISDDGVENSADQMDRIRELAGDLGGDLKILNADDGSTQMVVDLSIEGSGGSLDQTGDN